MSGLISYAQFQEDILIWRALSGIDKQHGFYIDVGANDPEIDSVTKLFYDRGWRGINVEPSPSFHANLAQARPRDINIHAACSDRPGTITLHDDPEGGLGTTAEHVAAEHAGNPGLSHRLKAIEVQAVTLTQICEAHYPGAIHFLKIDVEGAEGAVLRGMDFTRFRPLVLCIECHFPLDAGRQLHAEWDGHVIESGYTFAYTDNLNRFYVANEYAELAGAFALRPDEYLKAEDWRRLQRADAETVTLREENARLRAELAGRPPEASLEAAQWVLAGASRRAMRTLKGSSGS